MVTPSKIGRPIKPATEGERIMLGLRVTADIKRKLEAEASKSGRSLSQEAEIRLQQSFDQERALNYLIDKVEEADRRLAAMLSKKEG